MTARTSQIKGSVHPFEDTMANLHELLREPPSTAKGRILRAIMACSSNQADLVRRSGMSTATVSSVVNGLEGKGTVRCERRGRDTIVSMEQTNGVAVGIELGFHHTAVVARRVHQPYVESEVQTTAVGGNSGMDSWLEAVVNLVRNVSSAVGDGPEELTTIGLGIPRMIDPRTQQLTLPLLSPWENIPDPAAQILTRLGERARDYGDTLLPGLTVRVDNDATVGALAESAYIHSNKETLVYVKVSTGIGAGIVISGRAFRGRRGVAGEIGHTRVNGDGKFCLCGGRGCLETVVGAGNLLDQAKAVLSRSAPASMEDLVERARLGNGVCQRILQEAATRLGLAIGDLCNLLNPDVVVLGGAFGRASDLVLEPCRAGIRQVAVAATYDEGLLVDSKIQHASAHGALLLGIEGTTYPP
jgi:predicted NBD/HSP70 family sugar kinase